VEHSLESRVIIFRRQRRDKRRPKAESLITAETFSGGSGQSQWPKNKALSSRTDKEDKEDKAAREYHMSTN